jgi:hypothetical protein
MRLMFRAGACATLICFTGATMAEARGCATQAEFAAVQVSAVQQELTDAALTCGPHETQLFNRFQIVFNKELRRSDARMLAMFKRLYGTARGNAAYDSYKTRAIAHAEQRRTQPGAAEGFCRTADIMFATALAPDKPALEDFVAGVQAEQENPVAACPVKLATRRGEAGEAVLPVARPVLPGDPPVTGMLGE